MCEQQTRPATERLARGRMCFALLLFCLFSLTVILLSLELIDGGDLVGHSKQQVVGTSLLEDVADEVLLAVIGCENRDPVRSVAHQAHVHVGLDDILCFG